MRLALEALTLLVIVLAAAWLVVEPGFEPGIVLVGAIAAALTEALTFPEGHPVRSPLAWLMKPYFAWKRQRELERLREMPIASVEFDTIKDRTAIHHRVAAWNIWDHTGPTGELELRHRINDGSWSTFNKVAGHTPELWAQDINGDRNPEILIRVACGAHSRRLLVYYVNQWEQLHLMEGGEIGSDWPEIELEQNGERWEIHAKQRDWGSRDSMSPAKESFIVDGLSVQRITTSCSGGPPHPNGA